jgi:hypothetical protein
MLAHSIPLDMIIQIFCEVEEIPAGRPEITVNSVVLTERRRKRIYNTKLAKSLKQNV